MPTIDILLNILIVLYLAIEESGQVLAIVSEADQERELRRFTATIRCTEGLGSDPLAQSIEQTTAYRREKFLFAYVGVIRLAVAMQLTRLMATWMGYLEVSFGRCVSPVRCRMLT